MYVRGFGGSWFDHPFWRARFVLNTAEDVDRVRNSGVPYVLIDDEKGVGLEVSKPALAPDPAPKAAVSAIAATGGRIRREPREEPEAPDLAERRRAVTLVARAKNNMRRVMEDARLGHAVRISEVSGIVDDIAANVERSPRTLLDVLRLKNKDEYTYLHSVAVCTLMVNIARFMGKADADMRDYGLAGLLHDIGKMGIPVDILNKPGRLTDDEFIVVRSHPEHGYQLLSKTDQITDMALDVCRHHHEKMDGTGYPRRLPGDQISEPARLGAICDVYDALTSDRAYKAAWTPAEALSRMWSWEGHFDRQLLFTFMQSIGVFPPGMLVRLRSNRLGIVLESRRRQKHPRVLAFYDTRERERIEPLEVVIKDTLATDSIVAPAYPEEWGLQDWEALSASLLQPSSTSRAA